MHYTLIAATVTPMPPAIVVFGALMVVGLAIIVGSIKKG